MNWEEDRQESFSSGRFKTPDDIQQRMLDRAQSQSTVALLYLGLLLFGIGLLSTLIYFLI
jgi:hypothetical protein|tara:strand:- start:498 stop:677 length:180 start_codon:yes stop_codon:yes gene_type:complete